MDGLNNDYLVLHQVQPRLSSFPFWGGVIVGAVLVSIYEPSLHSSPGFVGT